MHFLLKKFGTPFYREAPMVCPPSLSFYMELNSPTKNILFLMESNVRKKTPTAEWAQAVRIQLASRYALCFNHQETFQRLFFLSAISNSVWNWLFQLTAGKMPSPFSATSILLSLGAGRSIYAKHGFGVVILITIYHLWRARNFQTHQDLIQSSFKLCLVIKEDIICSWTQIGSSWP